MVEHQVVGGVWTLVLRLWTLVLARFVIRSHGKTVNKIHSFDLKVKWQFALWLNTNNCSEF